VKRRGEAFLPENSSLRTTGVGIRKGAKVWGFIRGSTEGNCFPDRELAQVAGCGPVTGSFPRR